MTTPSEEWTEDCCIQLIREFRARPILWDPKDPFFFKKALKPAAWEDIGRIINHDAESCKHKMIVLMSSFRREKAKIMHSLTDANIGDLSSGYKSTWFAFKEMSFLMDKENERKRRLMGEGVHDEDAPSMKNAILEHFIEAPPMKCAPHKKSTQVFKRRSKGAKRNVDTSPPPSAAPHSPSPIPSALPTSQILSERDEEIKSFITFIGNKMKKYSDETKNSVQQAICEIIFKADQHVYDSSMYEKFTIVDSENDTMKDTTIDTSIKTQILYSDSE